MANIASRPAIGLHSDRAEQLIQEQAFALIVGTASVWLGTRQRRDLNPDGRTMMIALENPMQAFQALSSVDKLRVSSLLVRGKAPDDPGMATAAVELAESYRDRGRIYAMTARWLPAVLAILLSAETIPAAIEGDAPMAILFAFVVLGGVGHLMLNPAVRPKNVARSLEASRQIVASGR